jgi:hypothetical protein
MNVPFVLTMTMVIDGALCGLAGAGLVLAPDATGNAQAVTPDVVGTLGFDAITVALLGRNKPFGTVLAGLLFGALNAGANSMQAQVGTPLDLASVLQALIVMFVAAPMLVQTLAPFLKDHRRRVTEDIVTPVVAVETVGVDAAVAVSATTTAARRIADDTAATAEHDAGRRPPDGAPPTRGISADDNGTANEGGAR